MSRIGKEPIKIEEGVEVTKDGREIVVHGPLGEMKINFPEGLEVEIKDGEAIVKRNDDSLETFETRLKTYLTLTKPLLDYYKNKGILYEIDSNDTKENIFNKIVTIIDGDAND